LPDISVTSEGGQAKPSFVILPNPSSDYLRVAEVDLRQFSTLRISDEQGRLLIQQNLSAEQTDIPIQHLPAGVYIVSLHGKGITLSKKVVKQ
jgi:hypothetical protein